MNMIKNTANRLTSIPANPVLVLTYVDHGQQSTSDAQNAILKDTRKSPRHGTESDSDPNPDQPKFFLGMINAKDPQNETHLSNEPQTFSINSLW